MPLKQRNSGPLPLRSIEHLFTDGRGLAVHTGFHTVPGDSPDGWCPSGSGAGGLHEGDPAQADEWITEARRRCNRVPDRYVWVSEFVALGHLEITANQQPELVMPLARRLYQDAFRADLPEFIAWGLIYQAEAGDRASLPLARAMAGQVTNPALKARAAALGDLPG